MHVQHMPIPSIQMNPLLIGLTHPLKQRLFQCWLDLKVMRLYVKSIQARS